MSAQVSRRAVLEAVGAVGGAGILFESMGALGLAPTAEPRRRRAYRAPTTGDFSLTGRRRARVVVLGAGIAGLTAAYELGKAGYDCVVLEASSRPGGRNWTVRGGTTERDLDGHVQTAQVRQGPVPQRRTGPDRPVDGDDGLLPGARGGDRTAGEPERQLVHLPREGSTVGRRNPLPDSQGRRLRLHLRAAGQGHGPGRAGPHAERGRQGAPAGPPAGLR